MCDTVVYLGRVIPRDNFRVYVYRSGEKKLVESYEDFEQALKMGYSDVNDRPATVTLPSKRTRKKKSAEKGEACKQSDNSLSNLTD